MIEIRIRYSPRGDQVLQCETKEEAVKELRTLTSKGGFVVDSENKIVGKLKNIEQDQTYFYVPLVYGG